MRRQHSFGRNSFFTLLRTLLFGSIVSGFCSTAVAQSIPEFPEPLFREPMTEMPSVSLLSEVQPTDWAYQALLFLVERYKLNSSYIKIFHQGNRTLSRYEFAVLLNVVQDRMNQLSASRNTQWVDREDLIVLQKLQTDFARELASISSRIDNLESVAAQIGANQFSPTTKLYGQAIFAIQGRNFNEADYFVRDGVRETEDFNTNINIITLLQFSLYSQISEKSYLLTGIQAGDGNTAPEIANNVRLAFEGDTNNSLIISDLTYRFQASNNLVAIFGAEGVSMVTVFRGPNRIESAGQGPISTFAQRNPILNVGGGRGGIGFDWQFARRASLQGVYSVNNPAVGESGGLFNGNNTMGFQLALTPIDAIDIALYYAKSYSLDGFLGTGVGDDRVAYYDYINSQVPLSTNALGATFNWRIQEKLSVGGWAGYTNSHVPGESGNVETINWMVFANFTDLFGENNLGGIYVGQPPKIISSNLPVGRNVPDVFDGGLGEVGGQPGTTTHVELFYRWKMSDNISITPGFIVVFQPRNTPDSDTITICALRTTFTF